MAERSKESLELVSMASQAQASKVREIVDRIDTIARLDSDRVRNISELLRAAKSDGGCGIGCW